MLASRSGRRWRRPVWRSGIVHSPSTCVLLLYLCASVLPDMQPTGFGRIVNISKARRVQRSCPASRRTAVAVADGSRAEPEGEIDDLLSPGCGRESRRRVWCPKVVSRWDFHQGALAQDLRSGLLGNSWSRATDVRPRARLLNARQRIARTCARRCERPPTPRPRAPSRPDPGARKSAEPAGSRIGPKATRTPAHS